MVPLLLTLVALLATLAIVLALDARRARAALPEAGGAGREAARHSAAPAPPDAFELLPLAALRVDAVTRMLAANARARERFPFLRPGQLLLESFGEHRLAEQVADALASGEPASFEIRLFSDDRRTYRVAVEPVDAGEDTEALVFMTDLTEAVAYQELRSQFVANVSHELRTPITGLRGLLEALGDDGIDPATHARFVGRAVAETQRLEALITDILFLSELEAAPGPLGEECSDLREAAEAAVEALAQVARAGEVEVALDAPAPAPVRMSERMARTVVQNLLENAIKYGGHGAQVTVAVRPDPAGRRVDLAVEDDGPGISERHLPHVFERFYRADASRSKRLGGTGLGLSIVKHIAERAGGHAEAASREGFGTTVTVRIPLAAPDGGAAGPAAPDDRTTA